VHASASPHNPTVPGTSAAIVVPKDRRPILFVASLAVLLGVGAGLLVLRGSTHPAPAAPQPSALVAPAPSPQVPPPPALPSASATAVPSASVAAASAAPPVTQAGVSPGKTAPGKKPPGSKPTDQVGGAGISSQF
jgi:hypothetical protein